MKRLIALGCAFVLLAAGVGFAGEITGGLEITGGQNAFAQFRLDRLQPGTDDDDTFRLVLSVNQAQRLKGYGCVLNYDPSKYELVEAREVEENLLKTSNRSTLFISSNRTRGQVTVGAMKVDGEAVDGEGELVEFILRSSQDPLPTDFQITEGVLVDLDGGIDAVQVIEIGDLRLRPDTFALDQNMPNPFNPSTTITYQMPESGDVKLVIYNLLGQEVRTVVDESLEAGYHKVVWDGRDAVGRQVASGIYIYRLKAASNIQSRRMMLLK